MEDLIGTILSLLGQRPSSLRSTCRVGEVYVQRKMFVILHICVVYAQKDEENSLTSHNK